MSESRDKRKKGLGRVANKQYRSNKRKRVLSLVYLLIAYIFIASIVIVEIMPETYSITVGEAATSTIVAIGDVEDFERTKAEREKAEAAVADVYVIDQTTTNQLQQFFKTKIFEGFSTASQYGYTVRGGKENNDGYIVQYDTLMLEKYGAEELAFLSDSKENALTKTKKIVAVLDSNPQDVELLKNWFIPVIERYLSTGINDNGLAEAKTTLANEIIECDVIENGTLKTILSEVVQDKLTANVVFDQAATENAKKQASKNVETVLVLKGTAIVTQNEIVTQNQYDMLDALGMLEEGKISYPLLIGSGVLVLALCLIMGWYVDCFEKKLSVQPKKILLLCLFAVLDIVVSLIFKSGGWTMMMNAALGTILIAILFNEQLALIVNTALSVVIAMLVSGEAGMFTTEAVALMISSYVGGTCAIYACRNVRVASRAKMLLPGMIGGAVSMCVMFVVLWLAGKSVPVCFTAAFYSLAGGVVAALFSTGSISIWENVFNLSTQSKLLELSNSGSDLLRRMSIEIPGTYQHSATVAEMAENAAKDIGANAMLARTASLYHDVGKLRTPECFTENQTNESVNFHSTLAPEESARLIFQHITDGVQIAKANKLPNEVIDVIIQHHGTSAVMYFYNKAKNANPNTKIDDFRYPGPNPQTKEAGIILLADCIEASVRALDEKNNDTIKAQIEKMFKARMDDGELDECELTLRDINTLKNSFLQTLTAVYHTRIKYDNGVNEEKKDG